MKRFYRSENGAITGVCKGLGEILDIDTGLLRLGFIIAVLIAGTGILAYLALAIALPRKDKLNTAHEPVLLGVCSVLSRKFDIDVAIIRFLAIISPLWSLGASVLIYIILKLVLSDPSRTSSEVKDVNL